MLSLAATSLPKKAWLSDTNRYQKDFVKTLKDDIENCSLVSSDLADYVAASAILHCVDGWAYFGRAIDCCLHGDHATALHLAYYAELRAAMSLLGSEGICIGDVHHVVVDGNTQCYRLGRQSTHQIVWAAFNHWSSTDAASFLLAQMIEPGGINIDVWFGASPSAIPLAAQAQSWLSAWGLDLRRLQSDGRARNEASYRPTRLRAARPRATSEITAGLVSEIWELCQPSARLTFQNLDKHLLHQALGISFREYARARCLCEALDGPDYEAFIQSTLSDLDIPLPEAEVWKSYLTSPGAVSSIITSALRDAPINASEHHIQVMCRALILLRMATGSAHRLLENAGIRGEDIAFWWHSMGEELGLWSSGEAPDDCSDLWGDIDPLLSDLVLSTVSNSDVSRWRKTHYSAIPLLAECERIALWGLGL